MGLNENHTIPGVRNDQLAAEQPGTPRILQRSIGSLRGTVAALALMAGLSTAAPNAYAQEGQCPGDAQAVSDCVAHEKLDAVIKLLTPKKRGKRGTPWYKKFEASLKTYLDEKLLTKEAIEEAFHNALQEAFGADPHFKLDDKQLAGLMDELGKIGVNSTRIAALLRANGQILAGIQSSLDRIVENTTDDTDVRFLMRVGYGMRMVDGHGDIGEPGHQILGEIGAAVRLRKNLVLEASVGLAGDFQEDQSAGTVLTASALVGGDISNGEGLEILGGARYAALLGRDGLGTQHLGYMEALLRYRSLYEDGSALNVGLAFDYLVAAQDLRRDLEATVGIKLLAGVDF